MTLSGHAVLFLVSLVSLTTAFAVLCANHFYHIVAMLPLCICGSRPYSRNTTNVKVQSSEPVYINSEELPPVTWYPLCRNLKAAIYAPTPAKLEGQLIFPHNNHCPRLIPVSSLPVSQYTSNSTTQPALISLHVALERLRILAKRSPDPNASGPRVMVLGPPSSGKTSVVKSLANMALGSGLGWTPGIIGLDPASVSIDHA